MKIKFIFSGSIIFGIFFTPVFLLAATSENYKIDADVISEGGDLGSSESYKLTDTIGEPIIGLGTSETYKTYAGFWNSLITSITLIVDSNNVDLGALTPGTPITGQSSITVNTDAWGGYDLMAEQDKQMTHTDTSTTIPNYSCGIETPCVWSGVGLGFTVKSGTDVEAKWGSDPNYKYAYFPPSPTLIHRKAGFKSGEDATVVEYKVDTATTQKSGIYSNTITYTAMSRL